MDITHSLQQPNGADGVSGGLPGLHLDYCKIRTGGRSRRHIHGDTPESGNSKSDGANMLPFRKRLVFSRILPLSGVPLMK